MAPMPGKVDKRQILTTILLWEGRLNNARLRSLFGLSSVRVSEWIREFREQHPNWTTWDSKTRSYHATERVYSTSTKDNYHKQTYSDSLSQYLALIGLPHVCTQNANESVSDRTIWAAFPNLSVPSPKIFGLLSEAIRTQSALQIVYRSMREPVPHQRIISPHNLVLAGRRWHARAFCAKKQDFRDYVLGRIVDAKLLGLPSDTCAQDDEAWVAEVPVRLIAHPELMVEQEMLIRFEYFNDTSARVDTCRGALVGYYIQDIRAAVDVKNQRPPDYQLAVANIDEVRPWLFPGV